MKPYFGSTRFIGGCGFTILELLVTLSVMSLVIVLAAPAMAHFVSQNRVATSVNDLLTAVRIARGAAIAEHRTVTLCGSSREPLCDRNWSAGVLIFYDDNSNGQQDDGERIMYRVPFHADEFSIRWRSFRNKPYMQYRTDGRLYYQAGNFTLCPVNGDERLARQLIVNHLGRPRLSRDSDGDGVHETAQGAPIDCAG